MEGALYDELCGSGFSVDDLAEKACRHDELGRYRPDLNAIAERMGVPLSAKQEMQIRYAIDRMTPAVRNAAVHMYSVAQEHLDDLWRTGRFHRSPHADAENEVTRHANELASRGVVTFLSESSHAGWNVSMLVSEESCPRYADARRELSRRFGERDSVIREILSE